MSVLGSAIFGTLPEATGIPPEPQTRIELNFGELPWAKPGTYIVDIQAYKKGTNQVTEQGYEITFE